MQKLDQRIGATINLVKLPQNNTFEFSFNQNVDWVRDLLIEMNENATDKSPEEYLKETSLIIEGEAVKKHREDMGEFLLLTANIKASYATECVRTLKSMSMDLEVPVKICFIDEELAESELFSEADDTYVENQMWDLYFYNKRVVNLKEVLHEQIFLNYEQYPILDADSPLLTEENDTN
ncbi:MAG: hypothetical protein WDA09_04425 [Bacteriovoracaceae bacterium]